MQIMPAEIGAALGITEHNHLGCGAARHLACRFFCRRGRLLAPQVRHGDSVLWRTGSLCYQTAACKMHRGDVSLPELVCRSDRYPEERSNVRVFLKVDAGCAMSFQIIRIVPRQV